VPTNTNTPVSEVLPETGGPTPTPPAVVGGMPVTGAPNQNAAFGLWAFIAGLALIMLGAGLRRYVRKPGNGRS
jgi:hypothetical protein